MTEYVVADSLHGVIRLTTLVLSVPTVLLPDLMNLREVSVTRRYVTARQEIATTEKHNLEVDPMLSPFSLSTVVHSWAVVKGGAVTAARKLLQVPDFNANSIVRKILAPFSITEIVASSTSWPSVIDHLRSAFDLDLHTIADTIENLLKSSVPRKLEIGEWHLPFVTEDDVDASIWHVVNDNDIQIILTDTMLSRCQFLLTRLSIARCLQTHRRDGADPVERIKNDLGLFSTAHVDPLKERPDAYDHQATPDSTDGDVWHNAHLHGNLIGWVQYRQLAKITDWKERQTEEAFNSCQK